MDAPMLRRHRFWKESVAGKSFCCDALTFVFIVFKEPIKFELSVAPGAFKKLKSPNAEKSERFICAVCL